MDRRGPTSRLFSAVTPPETIDLPARESYNNHMLYTFFNKQWRKPVSIRRDVFRLSMPVLLSSLFQRLVSIVDVFLTGGYLF